jgi:hypothetical protein
VQLFYESFRLVFLGFVVCNAGIRCKDPSGAPNFPERILGAEIFGAKVESTGKGDEFIPIAKFMIVKP